MNSKFQEYVSSNAFVLTLSKNQMDSLQYVVEHDGVQIDGMASNALLRRGLIEFKSSIKNRGGVAMESWSYHATLAGKLTYLLLIEAGFVMKDDDQYARLLYCPVDGIAPVTKDVAEQVLSGEIVADNIP